MKAVAALFAALLVLVASPALAHHVQTAEQTSVRVYASMRTIPLGVQAPAPSTEIDQFVCSGFIIATKGKTGTEQVVVTARHCTADEKILSSAFRLLMFSLHRRLFVISTETSGT